MLIYPQLGSGALGQYPITKRRRLRTVANRAADSRVIQLTDPAAAITEWRLQYSGLIDAEADALRQFFAAAEGTLNDFTFLDPTANLLAWSETLGEAVWTRGPLLSLTMAVPDPTGGIRASRLTNSGGGPQSILQTLATPGAYQYCVSAYVRSPDLVTVTLLLGDERRSRPVSNSWTRITFTASGPTLAESVGFGLETPATSAVDVFGLQVEPQPAASGYKPTTTGGVYEHARFHDDDLAMTATGVGLHSCTVNIIHANHL